MPNINDMVIEDGSVKWKFKEIGNDKPIDDVTIKSISLNGNVQPIDGGKNVDIVINDATSIKHGLMSNNDKINLDYLFHKTSTAYKIGDQVHVTDFPSYYVLECVEAGTTSNTKPDFSSIDIEATPSSDSEGGSAKINSISLNGNTITPDSNKNVNIVINDANTSTSGLMNKQDKANLDSIFHQTSTTYEIGDQVHVAEFPSYYVLECTNSGTTGNTRPDFSSIDINDTTNTTNGLLSTRSITTEQKKETDIEQERNDDQDLINAYLLQELASLKGTVNNNAK